MARLGWPRPPLLLGLVLGPLAENKLFLSTDNYGPAWLVRPGVLVLLALIVAGLLVPIVSRRRQRRGPRRRSSGPRTRRRRRAAALRLDGAATFSLLLVLVFAWALWVSLDFGVRAGLFPWAVCAPGLVLGLVQLARDLTGRRDAPPPHAEEAAEPDVPVEVARRRTVQICLWIVGFWIAIWLLGFSLATLCMTFLYLRVGAREGWLMCVILTALRDRVRLRPVRARPRRAVPGRASSSSGSA